MMTTIWNLHLCFMPVLLLSVFTWLHGHIINWTAWTWKCGVGLSNQKINIKFDCATFKTYIIFLKEENNNFWDYLPLDLLHSSAMPTTAEIDNNTTKYSFKIGCYISWKIYIWDGWQVRKSIFLLSVQVCLHHYQYNYKCIIIYY